MNPEPTKNTKFTRDFLNLLEALGLGLLSLLVYHLGVTSNLLGY